MVLLTGAKSNTFFEELAEWNDLLKQAGVECQHETVDDFTDDQAQHPDDPKISELIDPPCGPELGGPQ